MNKKKIKDSFFIVIGLCVFALLYLYFGEKLNLYVPCVFHKITGFYCPGCGITRMFSSILKFDFYQAFRYNALLFMMLPFITGYCIFLYSCWVRNKKISLPSNYLSLLILFLIITFGVIRNVPYFSFFAPIVLKR